MGAQWNEHTEGCTGCRNNHRDKALATQASDRYLAIPKLCSGSFFPSLQNGWRYRHRPQGGRRATVRMRSAISTFGFLCYGWGEVLQEALKFFISLGIFLDAVTKETDVKIDVLRGAAAYCRCQCSVRTDDRSAWERYCAPGGVRELLSCPFPVLRREIVIDLADSYGQDPLAVYI
ncbi:transposase [Streptomyces sp. 11x1]|nr:transposase [Streptomyces sp. 11x1]